MSEVLIVDDNAAFRKMLTSILLSRFPSMHIMEAQDGDRAIKKTENQTPDLIFMDVRLPDGSGFQVTRKIKAAYPGIVIIIITSYDSPEYQEAAFESGADFFVSKRVSTAEEILKKVESIFSLN